MDPRQLRPGAELIEQLALGLVIEEAEPEGSGWVPPEEAHRRSEAAQTALRLRVETGEVPSAATEWLGQYQQLLDAGWPWRVACFIAWSACPKIGRWPKTQDELAREVLGLTGPRQIATWRKKNQAIDDVIAILQAAPLMEHRADVLRALARSASDPDHRSNPDRKLFLEITGDYVPHSKLEVKREAEDLSGLSDAELDQLAGKLTRGEE